MTLEKNKFIIRSFFAALDHEGLKGGLPFFATTFHAHVNGVEEPMAASDYEEFYEGLYCALPNLKHEINELLAEDDRVVARVTARGQHLGVLDGLRPCGKSVRVPMLMILQLSDGKIERIWLQFDQLYLLQQIGALPSTQTLSV